MLIKPSFFYNNSQDSHNYSNLIEISSILGAPNQAGISGAATSAPPSRSAYAYSTPNFKPNSSSVQDLPRYSIEHVHEQLSKMLRGHYGIEIIIQTRTYHKSYPKIYDSYPYPPRFRVLEFVKFAEKDNRTTWDHVSQFLAQMSEASSVDYLKVRRFSLPLSGIAFSWFSTLPPGSILTWAHLEQRFHDHFYNGENKLKLSHLTSVKQ
jgi:hypothetical protein